MRPTAKIHAAAFALLMIGAFCTRASAQQGTISGVVMDRTQSVPIRGASIQLPGHPQQVADANGRFRILNVVPGVYMFTVEAVGYRVVSDADEVEADLAILSERSAIDGVAARVIRLRSDPDPASEKDETIYRYDRAALLMALKSAGGGRR